jgi:hypothetical protein
MKLYSRPRPSLPPESAFAGFRFPAEVIVVAVPRTLRRQPDQSPNGTGWTGSTSDDTSDSGEILHEY